MAAILFAHPYYFDLATVDSGDWRAALPVTNLQDAQPSRVARTTNLSNTFFVVEFTAAQACTAITLAQTNLTAAATMRVRGATSEANLTNGSAFYDSTAVTAWPATGRPTDAGMTAWTVFRKFTNTTAGVWWRVDLADGANGDGYLQAGRCVLAAADVASIDVSRVFRRAPADVVVRTDFGHTLTQARLRPRAIELTLNWLTEAEMWTGLADLDRLRGMAGDIVICADTDATTHLHRYVIHGVLGESIPFSNPQFGLFAARATVVELL